MNHGTQMGVAEVMDIGAGGVEESRAQRIVRSLCPITVACRPPENSLSERSAISTGLVRQPASATAKKFMNERLA
jgi:hypothetical protein